MAIRAFLQSLEPVSNKVPGPFRPGESVELLVSDHAAGGDRSRGAEIARLPHASGSQGESSPRGLGFEHIGRRMRAQRCLRPLQ